MSDAYQIVDPVVDPLGTQAFEQTPYRNRNNTYDIAVAGIPFYLSASQNYPYKRETAPYRRTQIDQTREPGEQTLLGWWLRSQSSFHLGAGVRFQEPVQGENVAYRFWKSAGVDPWQVGHVTLLNDVEDITGETIDMDGAPIAIGGVDADGEDMAMVATGSNLYRIDSTGAVASVTWGGTDPIFALAQDGENCYVSDGDDIYTVPLTGTGSGTSIYSYSSTVTSVTMAWVKQRLIVGANNTLYEIVPGSPAVVSTIYTHPVTGWKWSSVADGPNSVYVSGYSGTSSSIYRLSLDTDGTLPVLANAVTAADLPGGEYVTSIATYIGKFIAIGTNLGIRIGMIDTTGYSTAGQITYGPLSVIVNGYDTTYDRTINGTPVYQFAFDDRFVFATVSNMIDNGDGTLSSGLLRIDLSRELGGGMFAWASDLRLPNTADVTCVVNVGVSGKKLIGCMTGVFLESDIMLSSGWVETGQIRYLTLEDKHFKLIKPRYQTPLQGDLGISTVTANGGLNEIIVINSDFDPTNDIGTQTLGPSESLGFRFTLFRAGDGDDTPFVSPVFTGYQLKSLPAVRRARQITIPLMSYDFEEDRYNVPNGYEGRAGDRIQLLEGIESRGDTVLIQDFTLGETVLAVIDSVEFVRMTPPERRYKGFGGVLYVTARTV